MRDKMYTAEVINPDDERPDYTAKAEHFEEIMSGLFAYHSRTVIAAFDRENPVPIQELSLRMGPVFTRPREQNLEGYVQMHNHVVRQVNDRASQQKAGELLEEPAKD